jgi:hypothetical protein
MPNVDNYYRDTILNVAGIREANRRLFPMFPAIGREWFVKGGSGAASDDNTGGDDTGDGRSWETAKRTMADVFDELSSGDVVYFYGNIREQLSSPAGVFDVTIVGAGHPRHADLHTTLGGYSGSTWKTPASATAATPLLIARQQGWKFVNILFDGPSDAAAVQLLRDAGADSSERDASHAHFLHCKFVAAQNHIEFKGGLSQCILEDNLFFGATADSLLETVGAGVGTNNFHRILGNHFHSNASHLDVAMNYATIKGNTFGNTTATDKVDLRGGSENMVWGNALYGTYSNAGGYYAGTNDEWGGNYNSITGGVTAADPA